MIPIPYIGLSLMRLLSPRKAATEKGYFFINKQRIMEKISPQNQPSNYSKKKKINHQTMHEHMAGTHHLLPRRADLSLVEAVKRGALY